MQSQSRQALILCNYDFTIIFGAALLATIAAEMHRKLSSVTLYRVGQKVGDGSHNPDAISCGSRHAGPPSGAWRRNLTFSTQPAPRKSSSFPDVGRRKITGSSQKVVGTIK